MPTILARWRNETPAMLAATLGPNWLVRKTREGMLVKDGFMVNWGSSCPLFVRHDARILNNPNAVAGACSKLYTLRLLTESKVPCLTFTEDQNEALSWLFDGSSVVCRDIINGRGGDGIRIINRKAWNRGGRPAPDFGRARLFTRYFPKVQEIRVHVADGQILAVAEKRKRLGQPGDYWIRSHSRGWIFAEARAEFGEAREVARSAVKALNLDFGAVDIGIADNGASVVFEVNTAPGLEGRTLESYAAYFRGAVNG